MDYTIVEGYENIDIDAVMRLLSTTYWASHRTRAQMDKAMRNSACYGVRVDGRIVGFARVITDYATAYYLCDVVIDEQYRGQGLGKALVGYIESRPEFDGMRGFLFTRDAHGLYARFGYEVNNRSMSRQRKR